MSSFDYDDEWDSEHFTDPWAFDEHWRNWLDKPPLGWQAPKETKFVLSHTYDRWDNHGWAVRIDAWLDAQGIHMHFRWAAMIQVPRKRDHDAWVEAGSPRDQRPKPHWYVVRKAVMGWVFNWWRMALMEERVTDYQDDERNGKGALDLSDKDIEEL
jgi:hypothetical protein